MYQSQASSEGFPQSDKAGSDSSVWWVGEQTRVFNGYLQGEVVKRPGMGHAKGPKSGFGMDSEYGMGTRVVCDS